MREEASAVAALAFASAVEARHALPDSCGKLPFYHVLPQRCRLDVVTAHERGAQVFQGSRRVAFVRSA